MLGYIHLRGQGCTYEAFDRNLIEAVIKNALEKGFTEDQRRSFIKHVARLNKYYLFDEYRQGDLHFGKPSEEVVKYLQAAIDGLTEY
jgi:hypothetical protein